MFADSSVVVAILADEPDANAFLDRLAVAALAKYGKGRGHGAQLNLADCLSYACAKPSGVGLLYKDDDFLNTDMA